MLGGATSSTVEGRWFLDNLSNDLRLLSTESKKKNSQIKEAAEASLVKLRNVTTVSTEENLLINLRSFSSDLLQPFIIGCSTRNAKLVQISLQAIQKMIHHRIIEKTSATMIVNELWYLMEAECEELRILQTLTPLVGTELLITGHWLAKCLVICFRLKFAKDPIVINTSMATIRHMVSCVFDRVVQEDGTLNAKQSDVSVDKTMVKGIGFLKPCAQDAHMLFRDLCLLLNAESPTWLVGIQEMTRTLGLELIESLLSDYPSVFVKHQEFSDLIKDQVCPLVIKLFAPHHKHIQTVSQHSYSSRHFMESATLGQIPGSPERPYFPITLRLLRVVVVLMTNYYKLLVTECEIFLSLLVKYLEADKLNWQRAIAFEVLHKILVQPHLLMWFCENYDTKPNSTRVINSIVSAFASYSYLCFYRPEMTAFSDINIRRDDGQILNTDSHSPQSGGFFYRNVWIPFYGNIFRKKSILLDSLEKHDAVELPDGYSFSLAYCCLVDLIQCISEATDLSKRVSGCNDDETSRSIFHATYFNLVSALSLMLEASNDESITDRLLDCFSILSLLSCHLNHIAGRDKIIFTLCKLALPSNYIFRITGSGSNFNSLMTPANGSSADMYKVEDSETECFVGQANQIVAIGTTCPMPMMVQGSSYSSTVQLTTKNLQVARTLIACTQTSGQNLGDCWHLVLSTIQHLVWILGMKPCLQGGFRTDGDGSDSSAINCTPATTSVLTAVAMADIPVITTMLNKLFDSTAKIDDVALHHVIAALCKLSNEAMQVSSSGAREPSFFPIAKLQQTALANIARLEIFWKPITSHLIEVSGHPYLKLREWGAQALTSLIKMALKLSTSTDTKRQQIILAPLNSLCENDFIDVRRKQMDCLLNILHSCGQQFGASQWPTIIDIVASVVNNRFNFDELLVRQSYEAIVLMVTDFLEFLPFECLQSLIETDAKYGSQRCELNISLSALGQLWTISDFIFRKCQKSCKSEEYEMIWLVLYNCLSELCIDPRPPVRKSACQTLLQTISAHGPALSQPTWNHMIWKILFPMLDKIKILARSASTLRCDGSPMGASNMLIHHSRDTESKQWAETSVLTLAGVIKVINTQRTILLEMNDFPAIWSSILKYIEYLASSNNSEVSLAAVKGFQDLLHGKTISQPAEAGIKDEFSALSVENSPLLPDCFCLTSWETWLNIVRSITSCVPQEKNEGKMETGSNAGSAHLITVLRIFPYIFERVRKKLDADALVRADITNLFRGIIEHPASAEQNPLSLSNISEITLVQEAVLGCIRNIYQEMFEVNSIHRAILRDVMLLLMRFVTYSVQFHISEAVQEIDINWSVQNAVCFGESSLRMLVEFYISTAQFVESIQSTILVDVIKCLSIPMQIKYRCPSQSTWKGAVSAFIAISRVGLPIVRSHVRLFPNLWPTYANSLDNFLFHHGRSLTPLNADERKRHEFIDCQIIELIRTEILPYLIILPMDFVQRIIDLLNRGSISTIDPTDVLESYIHRTDLSRVCFDALLSMSRIEEPDLLRISSTHSKAINDPCNVLADSSNLKKAFNVESQSSPSHLGANAIVSLLSRCKQVLVGFMRDEQNVGQLRLPQDRILEMISVLHAISTLIDGLLERRSATNTELFGQLVALYPVLVDCIRCSKADSQVEASLIMALKAYQKLLMVQMRE